MLYFFCFFHGCHQLLQLTQIFLITNPHTIPLQNWKNKKIKPQFLSFKTTLVNWHSYWLKIKKYFQLHTSQYVFEQSNQLPWKSRDKFFPEEPSNNDEFWRWSINSWKKWCFDAAEVFDLFLQFEKFTSMVFVGLKLRCLNPFKALLQIFSALMLSLVVFVLTCTFNSFSILQTSLLCSLECLQEICTYFQMKSMIHNQQQSYKKHFNSLLRRTLL